MLDSPTIPSIRSNLQVKYWAALFGGVLFAIVVWAIMTLQFRYVMAISVGIAMISVAMMAIRRIEDFLIYALVFNIPFSIFGKWLFNYRLGFPARGISLGLAEVLILASYTLWFSQIFVTRRKPIPRLHKIDYFVFLLLFAQLISLIKAPDKLQGIFDIIYNIKHILIYFFIAHNVKRHNLKWIVVFLLFAILFESSIALLERATGALSVGHTKMNVESAEFGTQASVPGIEDEIRAAGTTLDPHALGLYYSMILPIPFVLLTMRFPRLSIRVILAGILIMGIIGLVMTFSRSGWLSFAISSIFASGVIVFSWKEGKAVLVAILICLAVSLLYPQLYGNIYKRLFDAPSELIEVRFKMAQTALSIWRQNFFFGYGPGSYLDAIHDPDITLFGYYDEMEERPVHCAYLWTAAEIGLFGLIAFYGMILLAIFRCWKMLKCKDLIIRGLGLGIMTGLIAYMLDGITNMMFREATPYAQLWIYIGLSLSFKRLLKEQTRHEPSIPQAVPSIT